MPNLKKCPNLKNAVTNLSVKLSWPKLHIAVLWYNVYKVWDGFIAINPSNPPDKYEQTNGHTDR